MPSSDPNVNYLPGGVDGDDDWVFDGAIGGMSAHSFGVRRIGACWTCSTIVLPGGRANELAQKLLRSANVPVNTLLSSEVLVTTGGGTAVLAAALDEAKVCIVELKSVETITIRFREDLLDEDKQRHGDEISF